MGPALEQSEATGIAFAAVPLPAGLCTHVDLEVTASDTAAEFRSGDVDVMATPRVVALCEQAAAEALRPHLGEGQTSVGFRVEITHLVPVLVGSKVRASASLERVDGKRIFFNVTVTDRYGLVAAGRVVRVLVDTRAFMDKAR